MAINALVSSGGVAAAIDDDVVVVVKLHRLRQMVARA